MIERLLHVLAAWLGGPNTLERIAARPVGQVRMVTTLVKLVPIALPPGMLIHAANVRTGLACWRLMQAEQSRIQERIEEGRN